MAAKLNRDAIAQAGLRLLATGGIDGVTMRALATALGVQAPTLYWHVKNKRELLDAMADVIATDAADRMRPRRADETIYDWLAEVARAMRAAMLRYRDGARVFVGSLTPTAPRATELALTELTAAGFSLEDAAQAIVTTLFYTTGYVIEEQARTGVEYAENPYATEPFDTARFPLSTKALPTLFNPDADAGFHAGLAVVLDGIRAAKGG